MHNMFSPDRQFPPVYKFRKMVMHRGKTQDKKTLKTRLFVTAQHHLTLFSSSWISWCGSASPICRPDPCTFIHRRF